MNPIFCGGRLRMGAKNKVIAGDYLNYAVSSAFRSVGMSYGFSNFMQLNKTTVEHYETVDEDKRKSAVSAVGRGLVGSLLLGPVGLLAGLSAKTKGVYLVAIQFLDGKKSLLEIDEKIYKALIASMF
jgi:hypothetical protein